MIEYGFTANLNGLMIKTNMLISGPKLNLCDRIDKFWKKMRLVNGDT